LIIAAVGIPPSQHSACGRHSAQTGVQHSARSAFRLRAALSSMTKDGVSRRTTAYTVYVHDIGRDMSSGS